MKRETMTPLLSTVNFPRAFSGRRGYAENRPHYLPRAALQDGEYYFGTCRNAQVAKWHASEGVFKHWRTKFGSRFVEEINHPEDDDGFDCFVPLFSCFPTESDLMPEDIGE